MGKSRHSQWVKDRSVLPLHPSSVCFYRTPRAWKLCWGQGKTLAWCSDSLDLPLPSYWRGPLPCTHRTGLWRTRPGESASQSLSSSATVLAKQELGRRAGFPTALMFHASLYLSDSLLFRYPPTRTGHSLRAEVKGYTSFYPHTLIMVSHRVDGPHFECVCVCVCPHLVPTDFDSELAQT